MTKNFFFYISNAFDTTDHNALLYGFGFSECFTTTLLNSHHSLLAKLGRIRALALKLWFLTDFLHSEKQCAVTVVLWAILSRLSVTRLKGLKPLEAFHSGRECHHVKYVKNKER